MDENEYKLKNYYINLKIFIILFILLLSIITLIIKAKKPLLLSSFRHYINDCRNLKNYNRIKIKNAIPYFSICLPAFNMENYIQKVVLSILNQSFQDFEIIIVNDNSNDKTEQIIKNIISTDNRIKTINHLNNSGVYNSRVDAFFLSKGKYILLMDPDDMLLNPKLFEDLYKYNLKYNLDIIEFTTVCYHEKTSNLEVKKKKYHYHYLDGIIYQPQLSDIYFYDPQTKNYSDVQCRNIWNKIIRREILLKAVNYIGKIYYKELFITAEDTIINLMSLHFAKNFSNIRLPGYMYNIREKSMTHGKTNKTQKILFDYNHLLYIKLFYRYLKEFNKDRNFLFYELKTINVLLLRLKNFTDIYNSHIKNFYKEILEDPFCSQSFKEYISEFAYF